MVIVGVIIITVSIWTWDRKKEEDEQKRRKGQQIIQEEVFVCGHNYQGVVCQKSLPSKINDP